MDTFMQVFGSILKILLLYSTIIGLFTILPRRKIPKAAPKNKFAVLIAARNEESVIGNIIASLQSSNYPKELFDIYVIPNNCSDDTEGAALQAGAKILHCPAPVHTKGDVLRQAFAALLGSSYDAFCVFDADNLVDPDFLARINDAICHGAKAVKGKQKSLNPEDSWVAGGYDLYRENLDLIFTRPRNNLRLSAKLMGTGFAVTRELMEEIGGWHTETITEDTEFAAQLAARGVRIWWAPEAISYDEEPSSFRQSLRQRLRWVSGVQAVGRKSIFPLLGTFLRTGSFLALDYALFLALTFAQLLALIPAVWSLFSGFGTLPWLYQIVFSIVGYWVGTTALGFFQALIGKRPLRKLWKGILLYPIFTASWLPLQVISLFRKTTVWKPIHHGRTRRCRRYPVPTVR